MLMSGGRRGHKQQLITRRSGIYSDLLCQTASHACPHGQSCNYATAASLFFEANSGTLSRADLAATFLKKSVSCFGTTAGQWSTATGLCRSALSSACSRDSRSRCKSLSPSTTATLTLSGVMAAFSRLRQSPYGRRCLAWTRKTSGI